MSQEDIDFVVAQFKAVNERNFPRAMDAYADDVVLVVNEGWGITAGTYEGKEAVGEWFGDWFRQFAPDYRFEITETRDLGGGGVFLVAEHGGAGRVSGAPIATVSGYLYRVRDRRVVRAELYPTPAEALEAASSPEWSKPETD
jgi:ketosteroid isomerase-like protein